MHRHLFALAWADARVTGDAEEKAVTFRPEAKALDYVLIGRLRQAEPLIVYKRRACKQALIIFTPTVPLKGEGKRKVFRKGLLSGGEYFFWCA